MGLGVDPFAVPLQEGILLAQHHVEEEEAILRVLSIDHKKERARLKDEYEAKLRQMKVWPKLELNMNAP